MSNRARPALQSGLLLAAVALLGAGLLAAVNEATSDRILAQEKQRTLQRLSVILPGDRFDNDLLEDVIRVTDPGHFRHAAPVTVYRARLGGKPAAVVMAVTAPDGYNGDIRLLAGIDASGEVLGVRVVSHRETPGLGDPLEIEKSDWILSFDGKSLSDPGPEDWRVKRDGGEFDQFTGATVTPRAVVRAVRAALEYFEANRSLIFDSPPGEGGPNG